MEDYFKVNEHEKLELETSYLLKLFNLWVVFAGQKSRGKKEIEKLATSRGFGKQASSKFQHFRERNNNINNNKSLLSREEELPGEKERHDKMKILSLNYFKSIHRYFRYTQGSHHPIF